MRTTTSTSDKTRLLNRDISFTYTWGYLDTCPKNNVILFSLKRFCALG